MPRLQKRHLPHEVRIVRLIGEGARGDLWSAPVTVPAYVEQETHLRVDRRSTSTTSGQEITSSTTVVLLPEYDTLPRSRVTVWPGTPRERTSEVIDSALGMYNRRTPNHVELYVE